MRLMLKPPEDTQADRNRLLESLSRVRLIRLCQVLYLLIIEFNIQGCIVLLQALKATYCGRGHCGCGHRIFVEDPCRRRRQLAQMIVTSADF